MMQITHPLSKYYHELKIDETIYSKLVFERKQKLDQFNVLMIEGCSEETAFNILNFSRATYFRLKKRNKTSGLKGLEPKSRRPKNVRTPLWNKQTEDLVCQIRNTHRVWGKEKITVILNRDYDIKTSISTTGRILSKLLRQQRIKPVAWHTGKYIPKKRLFNDHAQRLPMGARSTHPGELIQVDHMTVRLDSGMFVKQFNAICPTTRIVIGKAYTQATSLNASDFLDFMVQEFPFKVKSIQVDGGSEFRSEFEKQCKNLQIPLFVLPPRSPKMNGFVERSNGTLKYEFFNFYEKANNLRAINEKLQRFMVFYNNYRPHRSLQCLTPMEYFKDMEAKK
ncbi:MAG: integrase core domain-containing protein [Mariniphaga sp.]